MHFAWTTFPNMQRGVLHGQRREGWGSRRSTELCSSAPSQDEALPCDKAPSRQAPGPSPAVPALAHDFADGLRQQPGGSSALRAWQPAGRVLHVLEGPSAAQQAFMHLRASSALHLLLPRRDLLCCGLNSGRPWGPGRVLSRQSPASTLSLTAQCACEVDSRQTCLVPTAASLRCD